MSTIFDVFTAPLELTNQSRDVFLDAGALELAITKERMRCDRHRLLFSIVSLRIIARTSSEKKLKLKILRGILAERLRLTDERGLNRQDEVIILLPHTSFDGALNVVEELTDLAAKSDVAFQSNIHTYPDREFAASGERPGSHIADDLSPTGLPVDLTKMDASTPASVPLSFSRHLPQFSSLPMVAPTYPRWKRMMDIVLAGCGLLVATPILIVAAIAIKLTSKGPVFFRQWRTGQNNRSFLILKLRTMVIDAEELKDKLRRMNERDGPAFKMKHDPRVTSLGKFFRATGLDELPQLWNVLIGDMSIVGPRPLPVEEDAQCEQWQKRRLDTKPGITCLWQISKSRKIAFDDWMRMDIRYGSTRSFRNDIMLMFKTVAAVVLGRVGH